MSSSELLRRLESLRAHISINKISAYVIPHCDAHQSEYIGPGDERLAYISGFTGSAGTAIVTEKEALLWTDGRYFSQAEKQLPTGWTLMRDRSPGVPRLSDWLKELCSPIGVDPVLTSAAQEKEWTKLGLHLRCIPDNLVDAVWTVEGKTNNRPSEDSVYVHPIEYAGESVQSKIARLQSQLNKTGVDVCVISALDEIAWLTNLRGKDNIPFNPVFFAYLLVSQQSTVLFADLPSNSSAHVAMIEANIQVCPYLDFVQYLGSSKVAPSAKVWVDLDATNVATLQAITASHSSRQVYTDTVLPVELWKGSKNPTEIHGTRNAHVRDGLAKTRWLCWLQKTLTSSQDSQVHTEYSVAEKLEWFRAQATTEFRGLSFPSISSFGPNAAIIHYKPEKDTARIASKSEMYLIDSGAQYVDGTTDVTRTMHFGNSSQEETRAYTLVLKGVIALSTVVFPINTTGPALDALARVALWKFGLDYRHGTGHGVGAPLCVHEGPHYIGNAIARSEKAPMGLRTTLVPGMLVTNEPGYYKDGGFGIRIENVMVVKETDIPDVVNGGKYMLGFDTLTLIPISKTLIDKTLLNEEEVNWLNRYHSRVFETHASKLNAEELKWLQHQCSPL